MKKLFQTPYGHFSPDATEYVITRLDTPRPWANVICPGDYGAVITQNGSGYSWQTHASHNRITRWEQDLVRDAWGKHLYCRDRDSGALWSLAWQPVQAKPDHYECRHGIGYTTIVSRHHGIESAFTLVVSPDDPLELWIVTLENRTRRRRTLELASYFEWNLGPAPDSHREFHKLFIEQEYVASANALLATKRLNTIAEHGVGQPWNVEWPHVAFHAVSPAPSSFETDKERFLGLYGSPSAPASLTRDARAGRRRSVAPAASRNGGSAEIQKWQDAIASLRVAVTLGPGEKKEIVFTLGVATTREQALDLAARHRRPGAVAALWPRVRAHWNALIEPLEVRTPDPGFDALTNVWLKYQAASSRLWGRTGYYQPGGAYGFRDQLQDSLTFLPLDPRHTRRQILLHAAHQFVDGTAYHWWHPLTEDGAKKKYNDDLLWLPFVTLEYLRETADVAMLDERAPFLALDDRPGEIGTLYEHCRRAIDSFWTRMSPRGVPLMGAGDWNDGLSAIGNKLQSESVWLAHFLVGILDGWVELERRRDRPDAAAIERYTREAVKMRSAVNEHFWDGDWYVRATKDSGEVIGSKRNREGRIFINAQTWAVLNDVVTPERLPRLLASLERHLYREYGPVVLSPAYHTPDAEIGYLTRYAPGARENGGTYTHAAMWALQAECKLGRNETAWRIYRGVSPVHRGMEPDLYLVEPYVTAGNADGPDSPHFGRGGWTWYSGSAAWMFRVSTEWILGVRPTWEGLLVRPCLPPGWKGFTMKRTFRGSVYRIDVRVAEDLSGGRRRLRVDGETWDADVLPAFEDGREHAIEVEIAPAVATRAPRRARTPIARGKVAAKGGRAASSRAVRARAGRSGKRRV